MTKWHRIDWGGIDKWYDEAPDENASKKDWDEYRKQTGIKIWDDFSKFSLPKNSKKVKLYFEKYGIYRFGEYKTGGEEPVFTFAKDELDPDIHEMEDEYEYVRPSHWAEVDDRPSDAVEPQLKSMIT